MPKNSEFESFYADNIPTVLNDCQNAGYAPLFMPKIIERRIKNDGDSAIWKEWYVTPSIVATGQTQKGSKVVVYAHIPNYLSKPENIRTVLDAGLSSGAGEIPQEEFLKLVGFAEQGKEGVFIVPYEKLMASLSERIPVDSALEHPQTLPFLGVDETTAKKYLEKHKEVYGDEIGIWHTDDFVEGKALGRMLCLGDYDDGFVGYSSLSNVARFFGARVKSVEE